MPSITDLEKVQAIGLLSGFEKIRPRRWRGFTTPENIRLLAEHLRRLGAHLSAITCIDEGSEFVLIYHFDFDGELLNVHVRIPKAIASLLSISEIYPAADFYEREVSEMFGIVFEGARRERLLLPDDWPSGEYPLRRW